MSTHHAIGSRSRQASLEESVSHILIRVAQSLINEEFENLLDPHAGLLLFGWISRLLGLFWSRLSRNRGIAGCPGTAHNGGESASQTDALEPELGWGWLYRLAVDIGLLLGLLQKGTKHRGS